IQTAGPGLTGVEEEGEPRSLKRCASSLTPEVAQQQLHYTDDSRIFPDETLWISTPRAIVIQPPGSAQPVDLKPTNSILPVNTLCDGPDYKRQGTPTTLHFYTAEKFKQQNHK
ncbi:hypothetical protein NQZ68_022594, partial [Dissostichus eleginoides]